MAFINKLVDLTKEKNGAGIFLSGEKNIRYFTGMKGEGWLISVPERIVYVTDSRYTLDARRALQGTQVELIIFNGDPMETVAQLMKECKTTEWLCEGEIEYSTVVRLKKLLPNFKFDVIDSELDDIRSVKDEHEIDCIRRAQRIAEKALLETFNDICVGVTERFVRARLEYNMLKAGSDHPSFESIVAAGANGASPHAMTTDNEFKAGDFVVIDFGATVEGYCSDMTRTVAISGVDTEQERIYNTVLEAQKSALNVIRAGISGKEADAAARNYLEREGCGEYFTHSLGHGVGLYIHESPRLSVRAEQLLKTGQVVTVEPGVYYEGKFGIRIEDMCVVDRDGCINLTEAPKNLIIL